MARRQGPAFFAGFAGVIGAALAALLLYVLYRFLDAALAISTPFVAAAVMALLLDPLVDRFQRQVRPLKGQRAGAVGLAYALFLLAFLALVVLVVPALIEQSQRLVVWMGDSGPARLQEQVDAWLADHRRIGSVQLPASVNDLVAQYSDQLAAALKASASRVAGVIVGSVSGLLSTILVPIITFYLLMDMDRLRRRFLALLPERARRVFLVTVRDVGNVFGGYVRGMIQVSLIYMVTAVVVLLGLSFIPLLAPMRGYALLIGVVGGLLYVIPYVGFLGVLLLTVTVGLVTGAPVGAIAGFAIALFTLNQTFDNVVTPRIVGGGVGIHPILSMFALLLGASLFGLWGMLLAVPVAGSIRVVLLRLYPQLADNGAVDNEATAPL